MKKLIEFLFSGCWHEWETIDTQLWENILTFASDCKIKEQYRVYTLRCKKCGEIKSTQVSCGN
jgi:hypothetical protein